MLENLPLHNARVGVHIPESLKDLGGNKDYHEKGDTFTRTEVMVTSVAIQ